MKQMEESHTALYRKYRPQEWKDVVGQDHVVKTLESAVKLGNISHAYLFSGSRGLGKTSIARILARAIGTTGNDLYEIDAASNRGIDDIRELRESVQTLPFESPYKVYIIDEAHMLTKEAFNALLKTLEEPPKHVVFMLATTETDKLPETIVSRCQTFSFRKPSQKVLKDVVLETAKKEGYTLEPAGAELIALLGDGSFRDTHGILQKVIGSSKDKKVSVAEIELVTGAPRGQIVNRIVGALSAGNREDALGAIADATVANIDPKVLMKLVLAKLRAVLVIKNAPAMAKDFAESFGEDDFNYLKGLADAKDCKITSGTLLELLTAYDLVGRSHIPNLPFELAVIKITS